MFSPDSFAKFSLLAQQREICKPNFCLDSTLQALTFHNFSIESDCLGQEVAKTFAENPLLPGVILTEAEQFAGMISRRRFLEHLSRPYGVELFLSRPLKTLYRFTGSDILILPAATLIVKAARLSLQRSPDLLYEPIVVEVERQVYRLLEVHELLAAQSQIHELTSRLLNEQIKTQLMQVEKMASLGQMVAGVAHEIRNPITCVAGHLEFLSNYTQDLLAFLLACDAEAIYDSPKITRGKQLIEINDLLKDLPPILASLKGAVERLTQLGGSLRNFSHIDGTNRQSLDLHECLESTLLILHNRIKYSGIEIVKNYGNLPAVDGYSGQLNQVFMNLLSNAIDALAEKAEALAGESGRASTWKPRIEIVTKFIKSPAPRVSVRIADNGPGIPQEIQGRIFETFFTTKPVGQGTGLGLPISQQIVVEKHAGQIYCISAPGQGAEFTIALPINPPNCQHQVH